MSNKANHAAQVIAVAIVELRKYHTDKEIRKFLSVRNINEIFKILDEEKEQIK